MTIEIMTAAEDIPEPESLVGYLEEIPTSGSPLYVIRCSACYELAATTRLRRYWAMGSLGAVPVLDRDVAAAQGLTHFAWVHRWRLALVGCYLADGRFGWL